MHNQRRTQCIVLLRVDYGEADRIVTVLTPDVGKLTLMAKGVRKVKSKLAGGIELFSTSEITYLPGRGSIATLVSTRLDTHYGTIVSDINRTMLGYELIKLLDKTTEMSQKPNTSIISRIFQRVEYKSGAPRAHPLVVLGPAPAAGWSPAKSIHDAGGDKLRPIRATDLTMTPCLLRRMSRARLAPTRLSSCACFSPAIHLQHSRK